jgi:hypothetical protein
MSMMPTTGRSVPLGTVRNSELETIPTTLQPFSHSFSREPLGKRDVSLSAAAIFQGQPDAHLWKEKKVFTPSFFHWNCESGFSGARIL